MRRRRLLRAVASLGLAASAGCLAGGGENRQGSTTATRTPTETATSTPTTTPATAEDAGTDGAGNAGRGGPSLPTQEELVRAAARDGIPAITEPAFGTDWSEFDVSLSAEDLVLGVERDGEARAYPLAVMNWHEVVNDEFAGPLLVTYCPLCGSGVVASRVVEGRTLTFGVSGLLFESNLVMYDTATESLWPQVLAEAISGPLAGAQLDLLPSATTTWGEWRRTNPDTRVLLPPPASGTIVEGGVRDYSKNPYGDYRNSSQVGLGGDANVDDRLHPKTLVVGVTHAGVVRAYPLPAVKESGVVNDTVGGLPVVVTATAGNSLAAYVRRVDGETLTFEADGEFLAAGGSRWEPATGLAVDGPHEGTRLKRANDRSPMFWFSWSDFFSETEVYGRG